MHTFFDFHLLARLSNCQTAEFFASSIQSNRANFEIGQRNLLNHQTEGSIALNGQLNRVASPRILAELSGQLAIESHCSEIRNQLTFSPSENPQLHNMRALSTQQK
jgi:hypothetical protein